MDLVVNRKGTSIYQRWKEKQNKISRKRIKKKKKRYHKRNLKQKRMKMMAGSLKKKLKMRKKSLIKQKRLPKLALQLGEIKAKHRLKLQGVTGTVPLEGTQLEHLDYELELREEINKPSDHRDKTSMVTL